MSLTIREAGPDEVEALIPILRQAEETEGALRWSLANLSDTLYRMDDDAQLVGAATMQWRNDPCEMMELAIALQRHRQGLGKRLVAWLIDIASIRIALLLIGGLVIGANGAAAESASCAAQLKAQDERCQALAEKLAEACPSGTDIKETAQCRELSTQIANTCTRKPCAPQRKSKRRVKKSGMGMRAPKKRNPDEYRY